MKALLALCAFTTTLAFRAARPRRRAVPTLMPASRVSRFFLGDRSKAPLRALVKSKLEKSTFGFAPELVDIAVDAGFEQLEAAAQRRGLDAVESGALQKQRDAISRDVAKKVAATIETPLGDALEEKLAGAVVDALLDQVMENASFLRGPADRLPGPRGGGLGGGGGAPRQHRGARAGVEVIKGRPRPRVLGRPREAEAEVGAREREDADAHFRVPVAQVVLVRVVERRGQHGRADDAQDHGGHVQNNVHPEPPRAREVLGARRDERQR
mmetsp:Transcript_14649/g.43772  ORF Transcript_14649/g.43772 Transcript_14649/m.43772 type:complete len:269 (-) Transcript_14649:860-1666(-)